MSLLTSRPTSILFPAVLSVASVAAAVGIATPAGAATAAPNACAPADIYNATKTGSVNVDMMNAAWGGPGITLTISLAKGLTVGSTFSTTVGVSVSDIISSAKADISSSIQKSYTTTATYSGSVKINSGWSGGGYLHAGAHAYTYKWKEVENTPQCTNETVASGTARSPYAVPAFWKTEA